MNTRWRRLSACCCLLLAAPLVSCNSDADVATGCGGGRWHVQTFAGAQESDELSGVSADSPHDAWAVGVALPAGGHAETLVERWQGTGWRRVRSPGGPSGGSFLNAVVALSASDVWAVGLSRSAAGLARTLILHWNGRRWAIGTSPNAGHGDNFLVSVAAASPRDVWAVGYRDAKGVYRSLVEHWDGRRWSIVPLPRLSGPGNGLNAVAESASGVVWAVGGTARARGPTQPLVLRFDGRRWTPVTVPASLHSATLNGVAAAGWHGAWVVGATRTGSGDRAFSFETAGASWHFAAADMAGARSADLNAIWTVASGDAWAVGSAFDGRWYRGLVEHGHQGRWSQVPIATAARYDSRLMAVAGLADGQLWAVGSASRGAGPQRALIASRCARSSS